MIARRASRGSMNVRYKIVHEKGASSPFFLKVSTPGSNVLIQLSS